MTLDEDPGYVWADEGEGSSDDSGDENDTTLLERELELPNNALIVDKDLPKYACVKMNMAYPWCNKELHKNNRVRTPARNII